MTRMDTEAKQTAGMRGNGMVMQADTAQGLAVSADGFTLALGRRGTARAGEESELGFAVTRNRRPVELQDYLGAKGHLVALRQGDLAYLHVHPDADRLKFNEVPDRRHLPSLPAVQSRRRRPHVTRRSNPPALRVRPRMTPVQSFALSFPATGSSFFVLCLLLNRAQRCPLSIAQRLLRAAGVSSRRAPAAGVNVLVWPSSQRTR